MIRVNQRGRLFLSGAVALLLSAIASAATPTLAPLSDKLQAARPVSLLPTDIRTSMVFRNDSKSTPPSTATWTAGQGTPGVLRVECVNRTDFSDHVSVRWLIREPIKKGDVLLVRFLARAEFARQESGEAVIDLSFQQAKPEFVRHVKLPLTASVEWTTLEVPFSAAADADPTQGTLLLAFGTLSQAVQIGSIELLNFRDAVKLSDLPQTRFTYRGREADAEWRKLALERIEKIRTAPISVRVIDAQGAPVPDATVDIRLVKPAFQFGTCVDMSMMVSDSADAQKVRAKLLELFDTAVIDNGLKWPKWSGSATSRMQSMAATDWLERNGMRMRGHNLVWPGDKFSPRRIAQMPAPRAELPLLIKERIRDIMTATKGRISSWDVINEMLHERDYFKTMPELEAAEWFKVARETDPHAKLFISDYGMLNSANSPQKCAQYVELTRRLIAAGAPIDGMGVQGHVGRQVRNPEDVLKDLDLLATVGVELQITEFDINSPDESLQADYTRDFLIALYSHPAVTGFTKWGFWEGAHWKPDAAMFRRDWSERPNAKVWRDLVRTQWLTRVTATTNTAGLLTTRGHLGDYELKVTTPNKTAIETRTLSKTSGQITIQVP